MRTRRRGSSVHHWLTCAKRTLWSFALLTSVACATARIDESTFGDFRKGLADTREQARLALGEANQLAREQSVARVVAQDDKPALVESDFVFAVSPADITAWDNSFALLDQYAGALQLLVSPDRTARMTDAAVEVGEKLAAPNIGVQVPAGVATAVTALGTALVEARAQKQALAVMQRTDPDLQLVLSTMQDALHDPVADSGLRSTVRSNWNTAINGADAATPQSRWGRAQDADADDAEKRAIITDYLQMIDARDAQLAALDRLRESLGMLGQAHTLAAQGKADAGSVVAWISSHLDVTKATFERFRAIGTASASAEDDTRAPNPEE